MECVLVPVGEKVVLLPALVLRPMKIAPQRVSANTTRYTQMNPGPFLLQRELPASGFSR